MNDKPIRTIFLVDISDKSIIYTLMVIETLVIADMVLSGAFNVICISLYVVTVIMSIVYLLLHRKRDSLRFRIKIEK